MKITNKHQKTLAIASVFLTKSFWGGVWGGAFFKKHLPIVFLIRSK